MPLSTILIVLLVIMLLGGFSGRFGGYGYGFGHGGVGRRAPIGLKSSRVRRSS